MGKDRLVNNVLVHELLQRRGAATSRPRPLIDGTVAGPSISVGSKTGTYQSDCPPIHLPPRCRATSSAGNPTRVEIHSLVPAGMISSASSEIKQLNTQS
jgi:hypothetical protein